MAANQSVLQILSWNLTLKFDWSTWESSTLWTWHFATSCKIIHKAFVLGFWFCLVVNILPQKLDFKATLHWFVFSFLSFSNNKSGHVVWMVEQCGKKALLHKSNQMFLLMCSLQRSQVGLNCSDNSKWCENWFTFGILEIMKFYDRKEWFVCLATLALLFLFPPSSLTQTQSFDIFFKVRVVKITYYVVVCFWAGIST